MTLGMDEGRQLCSESTGTQTHRRSMGLRARRKEPLPDVASYSDMQVPKARPAVITQLCEQQLP